MSRRAKLHASSREARRSAIMLRNISPGSRSAEAGVYTVIGMGSFGATVPRTCSLIVRWSGKRL